MLFTRALYILSAAIAVAAAPAPKSDSDADSHAKKPENNHGKKPGPGLNCVATTKLLQGIQKHMDIQDLEIKAVDVLINKSGKTTDLKQLLINGRKQRLINVDLAVSSKKHDAEKLLLELGVKQKTISDKINSFSESNKATAKDWKNVKTMFNDAKKDNVIIFNKSC